MFPERRPSAAGLADMKDEVAARGLVEHLLGDGPGSIYTALSGVLQADPDLPGINDVSEDCLMDSSALDPSPALNAALSTLVATLVNQEEHSCAVQALALVTIEEDPKQNWENRAQSVRFIAAAAERQLELYAVQKACAFDDENIYSQVAVSIEEALFKWFPYMSNYELLVDAESGIIASSMKLSAQRDLPLAGISVAFCGSGPLPLTGILLHVRAGARVILVDYDMTAVTASKKFLAYLARCGLVNADDIHVCHADAACVTFTCDKERVKECDTTVCCDVIVLASLLSARAKEKIAATIAGARDGPKLLLARSATGLVSKLAYGPTSIRDLGRHLQFGGEYTPQRRVECRKEAAGLCLPSGVLNSVQVWYRKV
jgi:hypothetical protein